MNYSPETALTIVQAFSALLISGLIVLVGSLLMGDFDRKDPPYPPDDDIV